MVFMNQATAEEQPPVWLGGEAHVRIQRAHRMWLFPSVAKGQTLTLAIAFLVGAVIGGGATAPAWWNTRRRP
ncbi:MAG: hypothetical protein C4293_08920 [Nitrospiraceae bacterium]